MCHLVHLAILNLLINSKSAFSVTAAVWNAMAIQQTIVLLVDKEIHILSLQGHAGQYAQTSHIKIQMLTIVWLALTNAKHVLDQVTMTVLYVVTTTSS